MEDIDTRYNDSNRAFLQAFLARGTLTIKEAKPVLAAIFSTATDDEETSAEDVTEDDFHSYVNAANNAISPFDFAIRSTLSQHDRTRIYALVNTTSDPLTQLATTYTADEISYIKRLLDAMFETYNSQRQEVMAIQSTAAARLLKPPTERAHETQNGGATQGSSGQGLTGMAGERVLKDLVQQGWFEKSQAGFYTLSPRALMELKYYLLTTYNGGEDDEDQEEAEERQDKVKLCMACKEIVTIVIINYYDTIEDRRVVSAVEPGYLKKLLPDGPPAEGEKWEDIQKDIETKIMPGLTHWQSPNFMAFFPASSTYPGMLGELYSSAFTAAAFNWLCSPAITELETIVLDWLAELLHLPECYLSSGLGGGVIQGSASEAIVTVMVAARDRYLRDCTWHLEGQAREEAIAAKRGKLVALGSEMAHSSTQKAALITGVRFRTIPTSATDDFAMRGESLRRELEKCWQDGLEPFYLTATLGTTATCAVDNFAEIANVLTGFPQVWCHVDAAYAGAALVCEEYWHLTEHFAAFDSFDMNMHKWLLTNFDASCLYVKNRNHLISALSITPSYLKTDFSGIVTDYRDWQIPLGRRFRALKIWFVMRTYGVSGLKAHIRSHVVLGEIFAGLIRSRPDLFTVLTKPAFALTALNIVSPPPSPASSANHLTKKAYETINARGEIFLTSGVVGGIYAIRVVSANPKTEEKYLRRAFDILVAVAEEVRATEGREGKDE
ncbi:MAG: hypothetical protein M1832_000581 [Thelocarpon impressellum]|nr:MAG: hypothetical protein M1832_000581 [Thelocarpon impressellum]